MQFNVKQSEKKFNPVTVELTFESQEELNWFLWISNMDFNSVKITNEVDFDNRDYDKIAMDTYQKFEQLHEDYSA